MNLYDKVKKKYREKGISGLVKICHEHISSKINNCFYYVCWMFPVDKNLIVFESEGDLTDNSFALYDYMRRKKLLGKYKVVWLVNDPASAREYINHEKGFINTIFVRKFPNRVCFSRGKYLAGCRFFIYDHSNVKHELHQRKGQKIIYLTHGFAGYKAGKGSTGKEISKPDIVTVTSQLSEDLYPSFEDFGNTRFIHAGMPRLDYFFDKDMGVQERVNRKFSLNEYKKVFLWMPTFRESEHKELSEDYINTETHLPILTSKEKLKSFNTYLSRNNILLIFKIHPLQSKLPVFQEWYSNMIFLNDEQLHDINVQLYQFIPMTDALITDYSSISADYMLLNKPMIFTLDDYADYKKSRGGFIPEDPISLWAGAHVYDEKEFYYAIQRIADGFDDYKMDRDRLMPLFYEHPDGNASKRICEFLGIK